MMIRLGGIKNMRRSIIFLAALCISLAAILTAGIFLKSKEPKERSEGAIEELVGSSVDTPDELSVSYPKYGKVWNFNTSERYYFSGSGRQLYTNYEFAGGTEYDVTVTNTSSNPIEVLVLTGIYEYWRK